MMIPGMFNKITISLCLAVCTPESCLNNGTCSPVDYFNEGTGGRFTCSCSVGYSGLRCEEGKIDTNN